MWAGFSRGDLVELASFSKFGRWNKSRCEALDDSDSLQKGVCWALVDSIVITKNNGYIKKLNWKIDALNVESRYSAPHVSLAFGRWTFQAWTRQCLRWPFSPQAIKHFKIFSHCRHHTTKFFAFAIGSQAFAKGGIFRNGQTGQGFHFSLFIFSIFPSGHVECRNQLFHHPWKSQLAKRLSKNHHLFNLMRRIITLYVEYYLLVYTMICITRWSIAFCGTSEYKLGLQHRIISENHEDFVPRRKHVQHVRKCSTETASLLISTISWLLSTRNDLQDPKVLVKSCSSKR